MQLRRFVVTAFAAALVAGAPAARARAQSRPEGVFDADFLFGYYDQDGDHSPVTGGVCSEKAEVFSPVILQAWRVTESI